jgi:gamma-glutamyl-gamma-aminobutyrate hydrolase PuuD
MKFKVYVVGEQKHYANFLHDFEMVDNIGDAQIVIFTGGEDVDPKLYGAKKHMTTFSNPERDEYELQMFKQVRKDQLAIGICRGSQFLCVANGGKLVQNIAGHAIYGTHQITNGEMSYDITSTHHQMQYPFNLNKKDYDILYYTNISYEYQGDGIEPEKIPCDVEICLYHKKDMPKCLAIQGHPEYMRPNAPVVEMINALVEGLVKEIENV